MVLFLLLECLRLLRNVANIARLCDMIIYIIQNDPTRYHLILLLRERRLIAKHMAATGYRNDQ